MLTLKQWLAIAGLIVLGATHWLAFDYGRKSGARGAERAAKRELAQYKADAEQSRQEAAKANKKLRERLAEKPAARVPEVISANPSNCRVPRPVADSLRDAVRKANTAL